MGRQIYKRSIAPHQARVDADGGVKTDSVHAAILWALENQEFEGKDKCLIYSPELTGNKLRVNGIYTHATKGYDAGHVQSGTPNDLTQTTANSQLYLGKINPSEPQHLQNQNGDVRFMSHTSISFAANEKWTYENCLNWNGSNNAIVSMLGKPSDTLTSLSIKKTTNVFSFTNESGTAVDGTVSTASLIGKAKIIHAVAAGDGTLKIYVEGVLFDTITNPTNVTFAQNFAGQATASRNFYGRWYEQALLPAELSATRIAYRSALLRSIFPEIPTVRIAGMDVACRALDVVCTPAGTLIPNVTVNGDWAALSTAAWAHHGNDVALGTVYGKIYNGYAKDQIKADLLSSNFGYHIATEEEWTAIIEAVGVAGLNAMGTNYWSSANGTNTSGLTVLGGGARTNTGIFVELKNRIGFWLSESERRLIISNDNTYEFATRTNDIGYYILLIKDYAGEFVFDSLGEQIFDKNGVPWISV